MSFTRHSFSRITRGAEFSRELAGLSFERSAATSHKIRKREKGADSDLGEPLASRLGSYPTGKVFDGYDARDGVGKEGGVLRIPNGEMRRRSIRLCPA